MVVYDTGTYETEKWKPDEVMVTLHGDKVSGRYVLFRTSKGDAPGREEWMVRRMDPPAEGWTPMPSVVRPMRPTPAPSLPDDDADWGYEMRWDGVRAVGYVSGGRLKLVSPSDQDITSQYGDVRGVGDALAPTEAVVDGEVVAFDVRTGRVRPAPATVSGRRPPPGLTVQYLLYDLLWLEGSPTVDLPYAQRRELLDGLALNRRQLADPAGLHRRRSLRPGRRPRAGPGRRRRQAPRLTVRRGQAQPGLAADRRVRRGRAARRRERAGAAST